MTMLEANDPSFWEQYPNGAKTYDAWGREILHVKACNPETGKVVRYETAADGRTIALNTSGGPPRRDGFHPAPLRVVANRPSVDAARACSHMDQAVDQLRGLAASAASAAEAIGAFRDALTE